MITIVDSLLHPVEISGGWLIGIASIVVALLLLFYAFRGIALFRLAKKQGYKYAYLAWIPFAWIFVAGKLCKTTNVFGMKIKNFATILTVVFCVAEAVTLTVGVLVYAPLVGYLLQGWGNPVTQIGISLTDAKVFTDTLKEYPLISGVFVGKNFAFPYGDGLLYALKVLNIVSLILEIFYMVFLFTMYFNFFRTYWPQHYFAGFIFSIFGLFPIFAFIVRNKEPVDYYEFMKARYGDYMNRRSPYNDPFMNGGNNGYNGNGNANGAGQSSAPRQADPFEEFSNNQSSPNKEPFGEFEKNSDPFEEFSDKNGGDN